MLREIDFAANRRLLEAGRLGHDCILAEDSFRKINGPIKKNGQRASGLRFADPRIQFIWPASSRSASILVLNNLIH